VGILIDEETMCLASNGLQEGGATRSRRSQNNQHLTGLDETIAFSQNVDLAAFVAHKLPDKTRALEPNVADTLLVISVGAETVDIQVAESNTGCSDRRGVFVLELQIEHSLCPGTGIEVLAIGIESRVRGCIKRVCL